ncbi:MAG TPA: NAD(P)-dependent oxidoreductase [Solirubrobacteraceae bacterium]
MTPARIGWIGTGLMGASMAGHLLAAGHPVDVFTRTRERAASLLDQGARWCDSPAAVAREADVVVTMLGYPSDVREVVLGGDGVLGAAREGTLLIDMTTSEPSLAVEIAAAASERGVEALDAPVSGGDVGARNATLVIMAGGSEAAFARARPLFDIMGRTVVHQGPPGAGQHTKMVNQIAISSGMIAVCEALLYAARAGLDLERTVETISGGAAGSWSLANYGPRLLRDDLEPGFKIDHFIKDLGIALDEARRLGLALPGLALAEQLYLGASAQGLGEKGTQALVVALARLAGREWPPPAAVS